MRSGVSKLFQILLSVPVRIKVFGIVIVPILILGLSLNYWVTTGLSDWLSYLLPGDSVAIAMQAGSRSVMLVSILGAIAAILFTVVLMFWLTQPLLELQRTATEVSQGDLDSRARVWSNDEIGDVASSFNAMLDHLVESQENLTHTNRQLSLMNQIALSTTKEQDIHSSLYVILWSVLDAIDLDTGWIYLFDPERSKFHLATWYGVTDDDKPALLQEEDKLCACQQELISGSPDPKGIVHSCSRFEDCEGQTPCQHLSFPLRGNEHPLGVLVLLNQKGRTFLDCEFELLTNAISQISEYISKEWLEIKLNQKEAARQKLMKALIKAQEVERSRLARELHDGAGQMLTSLLVRMKAFERSLDDQQDAAKADRLCQNVSELVEYIRTISYQNRPVILDEFGLKKALENLMEDMVISTDLEGETDIDFSKVQFPKEIETTIYRITQESLTNVIRHAKAKKVTLRLWLEPTSLNLLIKDDGVGFDVDEHFLQESDQHLGVIAIKERLELLGGRLDLTSRLGEGTELLAVLPMLEEIIDV